MIILKVIIIFHNYWKILKIIGLQKLTEFIYQRTLRAIKNNAISRNGPDCHCEERSDEAIHSRALGIALFYYRCQKEAFMIQTTDNVHRVAKISKVTKVQKIDYSYFSLKDLKNLEQRYQQRAVLTNDWYYYAELLEIRKAKR